MPAMSALRIEPELLADPPRPVRLARRIALIFAFPFVVIALLVGGLGVAALVMHYTSDQDVRTLKNQGVTTEGRVTRVWTRQPPGGGLRIQADYQFQAGGRTVTGTIDGAIPST